MKNYIFCFFEYCLLLQLDVYICCTLNKRFFLLSAYRILFLDWFLLTSVFVYGGLSSFFFFFKEFERLKVRFTLPRYCNHHTVVLYMVEKLLASDNAPYGITSLRRVYAAPDLSANLECIDLLVTANRPYVLHWQYNAITDHLFLDEKRNGFEERSSNKNFTPSPSLVSPARDVAWCPFKKGRTDAVYVVACRGQPLQLFDLYPEKNESTLEELFIPSVRASYLAYNDSGVLCDPYATVWLSSTSPYSSYIAAGYGGFEDRVSVRFFDVQREGESAVWGYSSNQNHQSRAGPVSVLHSGKRGHYKSLLYAGFFGSSCVDVIDVRHRCPAAQLYPTTSKQGGFWSKGPSQSAGFVSLCTHPNNEHLIFAGGRSGMDRIYCWDLRKPLMPYETFSRPTMNSIRCDIVVVPDATSSDTSLNGTFTLCASTSNGKIDCFPLSVGNDNTRNTTTTPSAEDGGLPCSAAMRSVSVTKSPVSGLASLCSVEDYTDSSTTSREIHLQKRSIIAVCAGGSQYDSTMRIDRSRVNERGVLSRKTDSLEMWYSKRRRCNLAEMDSKMEKLHGEEDTDEEFLWGSAKRKTEIQKAKNNQSELLSSDSDDNTFPLEQNIPTLPAQLCIVSI